MNSFQIKTDKILNYDSIDILKLKQYIKLYNNNFILEDIYYLNDLVLFVTKKKIEEGFIKDYKILKNKSLQYEIVTLSNKIYFVGEENVISRREFIEKDTKVQFKMILYNKNDSIMKNYFIKIVKKDIELKQGKNKKLLNYHFQKFNYSYDDLKEEIDNELLDNNIRLTLELTLKIQLIYYTNNVSEKKK